MKTGYIAKLNNEWNTKSDGTGTSFDQDTNYKADELCPNITDGDCNINLYVNWEKSSYSLSFNKNGGSGTCNTITKKYNEEWGSLYSPTKAGYTFRGWYTRENGEGSHIISSSKATSDLTVYANWDMNKPDKPKITNTNNNKWVKDNYKISVSTTTNSSFIGKWYHSNDNKNYTAYQTFDNKSKVEPTMSTKTNTNRNDTLYIKVCNKEASGASDTNNCSDVASTRVKIDKQKPIIYGYGMKISTAGGIHGTQLISSECKNNNKVTGHCNSQFKVTCKRPPNTCNWGFDYEHECKDGTGSGCKNQVFIIWDHNGWNSRKCGNHANGTWVNEIGSCGYSLGNTRATWTKLYIKQQDNAGNWSEEFYFYQTCRWCDDDRSVCS